MPDITLCSNSGCHLRSKCYRYRAKPNKYNQSYSMFHPFEKECPHFWDASEYVESRLRPSDQVDRDIYRGEWEETD